MRLAPYAMRDELTAGRQYCEPSHAYRSEFQRDRDRIVHTKAFRRLENKTQVFDPDHSDHFRNRLTHTIEVGQIARTISEALGLNSDLCEVLALSHDIGHPPFSHEGENVLDRIMREFSSGFDHNLHALRIVEHFEEKYPSFPGLNLTFEVREGIVKHSRDYWGDEELYVDISPYLPGQRPPLEAQLVDVADEIAYSSADLDDGYDSGLLTLEQVVEGVEFVGCLYRKVEADHPAVPEGLRVRETVRQIIDTLVTSVISQTRRTLEEYGIDSVQGVRSFPRRVLQLDDQIAADNRQLKRFLEQNLYHHKIVRKAREKAQHLIEALFRYYLEHPREIPERHYSRVSSLDLHSVACDYIAGMTDKYAQAKYRELLGREVDKN